MLKVLLKTRVLALLDQFTGGNKGKHALDKRKIAVLLLSVLLLLVAAGFLLSLLLRPIYTSLAAADKEWLYFALAGAAAFLLSFIFTAFYAQGAIFEAKDNEMLLAMPIRPTAILASRIGTLYFLNFFFAAVFLGAAGIVKLTSGGTAVIGGTIVFILSIFLLAMISTTLSCLLGWLVSLATRKARHKSLVQLLISLALLGAFYAVCWGDISKNLQAISENSEGLAGVFKGVLYPFHAMGVACTGKDFGMFLIFAAICIVPFVLMCVLMGKSFVKIVTSRVSAKKVKYEAKALKSSSVVWAMTKKELSRFFNSSSYMLNAGLGLIYGFGMSIFTAVTAMNKTAEMAQKAVEASETASGFFDKLFNMMEPGGLPFLFGLILAAFAAFTYISGPSISVESNNLWILKSMPLAASEILKSKALAHLVLAIPFSVAGSLVFLIFMKGMTPLSIAFLFLYPILANVFCALAGVLINLFYGKMNYPSIAKAVKSNSAALMPMLATGAATLLPTVLYFTVLKESGIPFQTIALISTGLLVVLDLALYAFMSSPAVQKKWDLLKA